MTTTGLNHPGIATLIAIALSIIVIADIARIMWLRRWRRHALTSSLRLDVPASRLDPARWHLAHTVFACGFVRRSGGLARLFHRGATPSDAYDTLFLKNRDRNAPISDTPAESMNA